MGLSIGQLLARLKVLFYIYRTTLKGGQGPVRPGFIVESESESKNINGSVLFHLNLLLKPYGSVYAALQF